MFYQESDTLLANGNFQREDVEKFDTLLFKNQNRPVRAGRVSDLLDADFNLAVDILEAYADRGAVLKKIAAICPNDDTIVEEEDGQLVCDSCDSTFEDSEVVQEAVYIPKRLNLPEPAVREEPSENYGIPKDEYEHVIVLIHGIKDIGAWQSTVSQALQSPKTVVLQCRFGLYPAAQFLFPVNLSGWAVDEVVEKLRDVRLEYRNAKISIIAHSFGTYVTLKAIETDPNLALWKMVFCGSVANDRIRWVRFKNRIGDGVRPTRDFVVNDCGTGDYWPVLGATFGWHYGMAGATGFSEEMVRNRFHRERDGKAGRHSLYFNSDFVRKYWRPFLIEDVAPINGTGIQGEHLGFFVKLLYTGWLRNLFRLAALLAWVILIVGIPAVVYLLYCWFT